MALGDGPPLSLRPFPVADKKPKNLGEFIARVNAQPGGFRLLSEDQLREQAAVVHQKDKNATTADGDDMDMSMSDGDEEEDDDDDDEDAATDHNQARIEVLKNIEIASNTAMLTLDSLSLLLSKQNPTQAALTLSRQLREIAGIGTLGADRLDEPTVNPAHEKDQEDIAVGWTVMEISQACDAAEAASSFLYREVEIESRYWDDVIGVQKNGWSVCKMPQERHSLGVRFGFSEASPEFKNNGLAPMRRGPKGTVQLDCGRLGGVSERLVITCERGGKLVGRSSVPAQTDETAPLEARVLEARNTLFSQELWHELSREARTLASYDVRPQGSQLHCSLDDDTKIVAELVALDSEPSPSDGDDLPDNNMAEAISHTLHILLSYAHRNNELMRIRPLPPHITRSRGQQAYPLLRPIIARASCIRNIYNSTRYISSIVRTLKSAGLASSFVLQTVQPSVPEAPSRGPNQPSGAQLFIRTLMQPVDFIIKLTLVQDISLTVRGRTYLYPVASTHYHILLPPASPLETICPPYKDGYPDVKTLSDYIRTMTARVLTRYYITKVPPLGSAEWIQSIRGTSIQHADQEGCALHFSIDEVDAASPASSASSSQRHAVLNVVSSPPVEGNGQNKQWTWRPDGGGETKPLLNVVQQFSDEVVS